MNVPLFLAAETIWQQQEGTLMSIEGTLSWISIAVTLLLLIAFIMGLSVESKLGRANRIGRASHDLIKELLAEQKAGNLLLKYIADREYEKSGAGAANVQRPTSNVQRPTEEKTEAPRRSAATTAPDIYRID
jgi:hypothetical protein